MVSTDLWQVAFNETAYVNVTLSAVLQLSFSRER
jgi:hypothetical protein